MDNKLTFPMPIAAISNQQYQDQKIGRALQTAQNGPADRESPQLRAVCTEMESLFINYLFKEMRATINKSGFISGGRAEEIFTSMLDAEYSRKVSAAGGIGLAEILQKQLEGKSEFRR